jgi:methylthioribulose-1-phosphate dehydratase
MSDQNLRDALIEAGAFFHERGWAPATGGNYSARTDTGLILTASGTHKGHLRAEDLIATDADGMPINDTRKTSAETALHVALYAMDPAIGSVLHTHSPQATVLSLHHAQAGVLGLQGYEMLKAFAGITTHATRLQLPILANDQNIERLAARAIPAIQVTDACAPGLLIAGHGLYAWGRDVAEARRHIEAFEFLFACELLQAQLR